MRQRDAQSHWCNPDHIQGIEGNTVTWGKFGDGIPLHTNCWKCNTEPMTRTCDDARESWGRDIAKVFANLVRNNK